MRGALISLCLISLACGGLRTNPDGGSGGGAATGGGSATGGGTAGGATAGGSGGSGGGGGSSGGSGGGTAGGATAGGSGGAGGGMTMLRYAALAVPSANGSAMVGISGRSGEIYAVSDSNGLFRSTGGGFTEIAGSGFTGTGKGVWVAPDGAVFPVSQRQLGSCMANCSMGSSYTFQAVSSIDVEAVCGASSSNVYAVTEDISFNAQLWHWNGSSWTNTVLNLGVKTPRACTVLSDGTVAIAGTKSVAFHSNGVTTVEVAATVPPLTTSEQTAHQWYGMGLAGTKLWTTGYNRRVSVRNAPDSWLTTTFMNATSTGYAIGGPSESEVYAGAGNRENLVLLRRFNGMTWSNMPELPTLTSVRSMYVAGPNEIYFGGGDNNGNPAVDKAFR